MERVELGPGYTIPRLVVGLWQLSEGHSARSAGDGAERWLGRFVDAGLDTFDCADIYAGVETALGRFLATRPAGTVQVHTKLVPDRSALATVDRRYVRDIVERSLRRLRVERLDLVQFHWWDFAVSGWVDTVGWLEELRHEGKIRLVGLTNFDASRVRRLLQDGLAPASNQVQYSLLDRRAGRDFGDENGVRLPLLGYGTLAGGFLTERWLDASPAPSWENRSLQKYALIIEDAGGWAAFQTVLRAAARIASRHGVSVAAVATRWVLDRAGVAAAVVGARDAAHLDSYRSTLRLRLDESDRCTMEAALAALPGPPGAVSELEREPAGRHAAIMRTELNRA